MSTVPRLRSAIRVAADCAMADEPRDVDARARSFIARLSGAMQHLEETELDRILMAVLAQPATPPAAARSSA